MLPWEEVILIEDDEPHGAALNMALDEVLLSTLGDLPLLRCYRWSKPSVSFGCFGREAAVRAQFPAQPRVRRWTGGGIVEHGRDFTFSLFVPAGSPLAMARPAESYRAIHGAVAAALAALGCTNVESARPGSAEAAAGSAASDALPAPAHLRACFEHPVSHDLLLTGRKIAGGAQRRTRRGMLHQGSIQGAALDLTVAEVRWHNWRTALTRAFAVHASTRPIALEEVAAAHRLGAAKYGAAAWTGRFQ